MIGLKRKPVNAVTNFVSTILQHFPPFRWEDEQEKAWMEAMIRELNGCNFSDAVLEKALTDMVRTRKDRRIPLVADCINACLDARRWLEAKQGAENLPIHHQKPKSYDEKTQLANDLVMGPEGRMAAKEGWILGLHNYAHSHGRLPPPSEFGVLRRNATGDDEVYERCVRGVVVDREGNPVLDRNGKPVPMFAAKLLEGLGFKMRQRRRELTDMVQKGERR